MTEKFQVYLFAQALDNKSADDYFEYQNGEMQKIVSVDKQNLVQNILSTTTNQGKLKEFGSTKGYFSQSGLGPKNVVLLISHGQKDNIGRDSRTALIFSNFQNINLDVNKIEEILSDFWEKTGRKQITDHPTGDYSKVLENTTPPKNFFEKIIQILVEIENLIIQIINKFKGDGSVPNKGKGE